MIIGDPIHFNDILGTEGAKHVSRKHLYDAVSSRIGQRLYDLKVQVDRASLAQESMMSHDTKISSDRAAEIFHRVDWDTFGMGAQFSEEFSASSNKQIAQTDDGIIRSPKRGVSSEGGIGLKIKKFMDSTEMMGFAARGLFMNEYKSRGETAKIRPLKAWKEYLEVNLLNRGLQQHTHTC